MAKIRNAGLGILFMLVFAGTVLGEITHIGERPIALNVIVPQSRRIAFFQPETGEAIAITDVKVLIDILESTATTTIEIRLENRTNRRQEAELLLPVPDDVVIRGFAYDGPGGEITAKILAKDEARRIYEQLVAKIRDPALVEFIGYRLIRSSVFPVEPRGKQKVRITYEHLLETDGDRVDYVLPRTESLDYDVPWEITVNIRAKRAISTVYSPSHKVEIVRSDEKNLKVKLAEKARREPGPFRLSYLHEHNGVTASMLAYPDDKVGGGYFLLIAGLPAEPPKSADQKIKREITLVIDQSGSMRNEKIEQVKEAALQVIAGLEKGEAFNIIVYSNTVQRFSPNAVIKTDETAKAAKAYIEGITASGGTNIYDALKAALEQKPTEDMLPIVLFLTDGLPTVGQTSEVAIRELVIKSNPYKRRVFTFGVGVDLNAPLLDKIASESKGKSEFVLPKEDVEVKIGKVFQGLKGPVLADVELEVLGNNGKPAVGRTRDILPDRMPDLFEGDQVILLGQYVGTDPITFKLNGNYLGRKRAFQFTFEFDKATVKNGFVPRLWASRKIAQLIDAVRQMGAEPGTSTTDPKIKELVDEIVKLSMEYGILTEYTAFLATDGTNLADRDEVLREAGRSLDRALEIRSGSAGVSQSKNVMAQKAQQTLNIHNTYLNDHMEEVLVTNVQQINSQAYYRKGNRWVDSRLVSRESDIKPSRVIEFATPEYFELVAKLAKASQQGSVARQGDILLMVDGEPVLVKGPGPR
ncbi:MAG: VWA domain-containing protein [Sedimentisphaerales bacterium]|nr:VWA domain-containing protein [Sedimentisphaerales bacterium]